MKKTQLTLKSWEPKMSDRTTLLTDRQTYDCDYDNIYLQVYCTLLAKSETSGFLSSVSNDRDRAKAEAIAQLAGIHANAIVEYLKNNFAEEPQSLKS